MRAWPVLAAGWFVTGTAFADVYRVGNTDLDYCDYSSIQDAINAATANGPGLETILIANTGTYANLTLVVGDKSLMIEGGFDTCEFANPDVPADLGGSPTDAVISIQPSPGVATQVTLHGLRIHDGGYYDPVSHIGGNGGGVYIVNGAVVTIEDTTIENNIAGSGAGIYLQRNVNVPTLQLNPGVKIRNNHAYYEGGGVFVYSYANLNIAADDVNIDHNVADRDGGGLAATDRAVISIGNPAQLPGRHNVSGTSISGNSAGVMGGGVSLSFQAQVFAYELILDSNTAGQSGGGIAATHGGYLYMARDYLPNANEFQCPNNLQCSRISNNSVASGAAGTQGGAIALYSGSRADIAQTIIRGNTAQDGSAAYVDDGTILNMESVLVTGNQSNDSSGGGKTFRTNFSATAPQVRIAYATFAGNYNMSNGTNYLAQDIQAKGGTQLSIFSSAFYDNLDVGASSPFTDDCVVGSFNNSSSAYGTYTRKLVTSTPGFVDAAAGDYRLQGSSALNDYCDASAYAASYRDILLTPRCKDDPGKSNTYGTCDAGAYEYDFDQIFGNGFQ